MRLRIEVIYALPQKQQRVCLELPEGSTALDAVLASGLPRETASGQAAPIGVWGKAVTPAMRLRDGDRVEIYRPLASDPKQARRERAAKRPKISDLP